VAAIRLLVLLALTVAALATATPAEAQECAGRAILLFRTAVYSEEPTPADLPANPGAPLAFGRLGFLPGPEGTANCDPRSVQVSEVDGLPPDLAVTVENRAGFVFILGALCAGFEDEDRAACILRPLQFDDRLYTAARYPNGTEPRFRTGETLGGGELDDEQVSPLRLEGVDPAVAVGLEGHPDEAFVAEGACPYERFAAEQREDDLLRCLQGPLWFVFELERPPAATAGDRITAQADRAVQPMVDGATVSLARLPIPADLVPRDRSDAVEVGTIKVGPQGEVSLPITVPDVDEGVYEAIVTCEACAEAFGGRTVFPAGSLAIIAAGSEGPRILGIVLGALAVLLAIAAIVVWRRGWYRPPFKRRRPPPGGDK
jgi:hypothetical protein